MKRKDGRRTEAFAIIPMRAPGSGWQFWSGIIGLSERMYVFDGDCPVGNARDLTERRRRALAKRMIKLWTMFGEGRIRA